MFICETHSVVECVPCVRDKLQTEVERLKGNLSADAIAHEAEVNAIRKSANLQVGELMSLLKKYEWADSSGPESVKICPECGQDKDYGHNNDCILAKVVGSDRYHHSNESPSKKPVIESHVDEEICAACTGGDHAGCLKEWDWNPRLHRRVSCKCECRR